MVVHSNRMWESHMNQNKYFRPWVLTYHTLYCPLYQTHEYDVLGRPKLRSISHCLRDHKVLPDFTVRYKAFKPIPDVQGRSSMHLAFRNCNRLS